MTERPGPFSAQARHHGWHSLGERELDLVVVGGGITGAGIARDAALRGLSVALLDARDLAEGTSSRSSRLIHGGLRYLETLDFRLVFEASAERRRLLELAPHLVSPLPFLFPLWRGGPVGPLKLRAGMWLYDALSAFRNIERHRMLGREGALAREPALRSEGLVGGAVYYDAQVDDARLTVAVARGAHGAGAVVVPHAEVIGFIRGEEERVAGVRVRDCLRGGEREVRARVVINATGPWSDSLRTLADADAAPRLRPTKGVHLVMRRERVGNAGALVFPSPLDQRVMFILPWGDLTYVGTTDTDSPGPPEDAVATPEDVRYLLASANAVFPAANLANEDVLATWAGVRPLLAPRDDDDGEMSEGQTSREHDVWHDRSGLLNVAGGKLTTFRVMAADAVDAAAELLARQDGRAVGPSTTAGLPLPGAPPIPLEALAEELRHEFASLPLPPAAVRRLAGRYGADARTVLDSIRRDPALGERIGEGLDYLWAEVAHGVRHEMATTLEDLLRRRLQLFYEAPDADGALARAVAERVAGEPGLGWDAADVERQVTAYRRRWREARPAPRDALPG